MASPITLYYSSAWGYEQVQINNQLALVSVSLLSDPANKFTDGLGNITKHVGCSSYTIRVYHTHVKYALDIIAHDSFPCNINEFNQRFRFREWDMVCEAMLVAVP